MAEKKASPTFFALRTEVQNRKFRPIYVLHGEESYYIDQLSELIVNTALTEDERDFNLEVFYGNDALVGDVINSCKQFPAFAQHRVVVLREAQLIVKQPGRKDELNLFMHYAQKPLASTILVICYKGGKISAKQFTDEAVKSHDSAPTPGVVLESAKVKDSGLPALIKTYCTDMGVAIDNKSMMMMAEFVGTDLSRLFGELDKLRILVEGNPQGITPELIERNIGISKDYNNFELEDALRRRDALKAYSIIDYFEKNPKNNPVQNTVGMLFSFFSNVLIVRATKDQSPSSLMAATGNKSSWRIEKFCAAARNFSTQACVNIITYLRECDVKSKGMGSHQDSYALLRELIYKILHA